MARRKADAAIRAMRREAIAEAEISTTFDMAMTTSMLVGLESIDLFSQRVDPATAATG